MNQRANEFTSVSGRRGLLCAVTFTSFLLLGGPLSSAPEGKAEEKITYDDHVAPLFRQSCLRCHNEDRRRGGIALDSYARVIEGGSSGAAVAAGDSASSRLFLLVSHQEEPFMPPRGKKLEDADLELIRRWIDEGLLENQGSQAQASKRPKTDLSFQGDASQRPAGPPPMPEEVSLAPVVTYERPDAITALAASPWAPLVAFGAPRQVILYHLDALQVIGILPFPEGMPRVLKFSRSGALLLAGGGKGGALGRVAVFEVRTGKRVAEVGEEYDSVLAADISSDHTRVALGGPGRRVKIYSTADGSLLHSIKKHTDWVTALEFSPDGVLLASGDRAGGLHVWESLTGRHYLDLRGHKAGVTDVSWRADSNLLASSSEDRSVRLWEMENGRQVKTWNAHGAGTLAVEFFRDGRIATSGRDRQAKLFSADGKQLRSFSAFGDIATTVAFGHEGRRVIAGDWTGEVRVFGAEEGQLVGNLPARPPTIAERIAQARADLEKTEGRLEELAALVEGAEEAVAGASGEVEAARKVLEEKQSVLDAATGELEKQKGLLESARAEVESTRRKIAAWEEKQRPKD